MKCTGRKNAVAQKGWLNTGTTKRRFLPFLHAILKFMFNLWSKFSPSRCSVISNARTMLNLKWKGSGSLRYLLSESDLQSLSSCRAYTTKKSERSLLQAPLLHLVCLNEQRFYTKHKKLLTKAQSVQEQSLTTMLLYVFFPELWVTVRNHQASCLVQFLPPKETIYKMHWNTFHI